LNAATPEPLSQVVPEILSPKCGHVSPILALYRRARRLWRKGGPAITAKVASAIANQIAAFQRLHHRMKTLKCYNFWTAWATDLIFSQNYILKITFIIRYHWNLTRDNFLHDHETFEKQQTRKIRNHLTCMLILMVSPFWLNWKESNWVYIGERHTVLRRNRLKSWKVTEMIAEC